MKTRAISTAVVAVLAAVLVFMAGSSDTARADPGPVEAGHDLFETSDETWQDLMLPPDFFGPGCEPFVGRVYMEGVPFVSFAGVDFLFPTDTIVQRLQDAGPTFPDTIDIEIVRLELVSVAPITVTGCVGGDQPWEMKAQVPEGDANQTPGTMTIRHEYPDGGTFDSVLLVDPLLTFTRVGGGVGSPIGPMYLSAMTGGPLEFSTPGPQPWCHTGNPLDDPPNQFILEKPPLTTNFFPGVTCPDSPHMPGYGLDGERTKRSIKDIDIAEQKYGHEVRVAERPLSIGGTVELLAGDSDATSAAEGSNSASDYAVPLAAAVTAAVALATVGGWYALRRRVR